MRINREDVIWNYIATFLKIAVSSLILPFIVSLPSETVGIWCVFVTVNSLILLFDFGFNPSFTRNITYIISGVQELKVKGYVSAKEENVKVDYGLLKGVINAMQWFYFRTAIIFFILLITIGTFYIHELLKSYSGNRDEVYIAWFLLCCINTFNLATLYYDSLLQGKGLVKKSRQIVIISQLSYSLIAVIFITAGMGLIAIVAAQAISVIIVRWLSHRLFYTDEVKISLSKATASAKSEILKIIYPNAIKIGITTLSSILVQRSAIIIGSLYLTLPEIASYGITMQIILLISGISGVYINTYQSKIVQMRVQNDKKNLKEIYIKGQLIFVTTFIFSCIGLLLVGKWVFNFFGSQTQLLPSLLLLLALLLSFEQTNFLIAGNILSTKNEVPFFKASLIGGIGTVFGLIVSFQFFNIGMYGMLIIPLLVDATYQTWKWPLEVMKDLKLKFVDFFKFEFFRYNRNN